MKRSIEDGRHARLSGDLARLWPVLHQRSSSSYQCQPVAVVIVVTGPIDGQVHDQGLRERFQPAFRRPCRVPPQRAFQRPKSQRSQGVRVYAPVEINRDAVPGERGRSVHPPQHSVLGQELPSLFPHAPANLPCPARGHEEVDVGTLIRAIASQETQLQGWSFEHQQRDTERVERGDQGPCGGQRPESRCRSHLRRRRCARVHEPGRWVGGALGQPGFGAGRR